MTTIFDCYQMLLFIANKALGGFLSPADGGRALTAGQQIAFDRYLRMDPAKNREASQALQPFIKTVAATSSSTGLITIPIDFARTRDIYHGTATAGTRKSYSSISAPELDSALSSTVRPIDQMPRYMEETGGIQLFPASLQTVTHNYWARPADPVIGFDPDPTTGDPVYNAGTSTQLTFHSHYWVEVVHMACKSLGVNLSSESLFALAKEFEAR